MDLKKTGAFIAQCRKAQGLTQNQLAAHLAVTDKAVSRWETGRGFPDPATLPALAETLGITVTDLVNGEASAKVETQESADDAVLAALQYAAQLRRKTLGAVLLAAGLLCIFYSLVIVGTSTLSLAILGAALSLGGVWLLSSKCAAKAPRFLSPRTAHIGSLIALAIAFVLEWLPQGVEMRWATPPGEPAYVSYCAYFSLLPLGYGNVFPLLTACLTTTALVLTLATLVRKKQSSRLFVLSVLALLFSIVPALLGLGALTPVGWGICAALTFNLALRLLAGRGTAL